MARRAGYHERLAAPSAVESSIGLERSDRKQMKRVLTALFIIPPVLAGVLWLRPWIFSLIAGVIALLAAAEFLNLAETAGFRTARWTALITIALWFAMPFANRGMIYGPAAMPLRTWLIIGVLILAAFFSFLTSLRQDDPRSAFAGAGASMLCIVYVGFGLGALVLLKDLELGPFLILYLFVIVWAGDIFAYYVGRAFGRHKMSPVISPGKTWEGAAASLISSVVLGWLFFYFALPISGWMTRVHALTHPVVQTPGTLAIVLVSALLNIVAQLGDLFESFVKRAAGVKDSGALLPGHGGILDRIDALMFAAPLLWFYAIAAGAQ
jgi:phosphatidate cytidylyltransferase